MGQTTIHTVCISNLDIDKSTEKINFSHLLKCEMFSGGLAVLLLNTDLSLKLNSLVQITDTHGIGSRISSLSVVAKRRTLKVVTDSLSVLD